MRRIPEKETVPLIWGKVRNRACDMYFFFFYKGIIKGTNSLKFPV